MWMRGRVDEGLHCVRDDVCTGTKDQGPLWYPSASFLDWCKLERAVGVHRMKRGSARCIDPAVAR